MMYSLRFSPANLNCLKIDTTDLNKRAKPTSEAAFGLGMTLSLGLHDELVPPSLKQQIRSKKHLARQADMSM